MDDRTGSDNAVKPHPDQERRPIHVSLTVWLLTVAALCALVAVDFLIGRRPHDVSIKEAATWSIVWVAHHREVAERRQPLRLRPDHG